MAETGQDLQKAKQLLEDGQLVAIPTETVYGLAGNALDKDAIVKIFKTKNRPAFDPLIAHVHSVEEISKIAAFDTDLVLNIGHQFWPGPLTMLLPKKDHVPELLTSGLQRVAVRIPNHPLSLELLRLLDFPLAAPSANPFGYVSPTSAQHVNDQLGEKINYILDGGPTSIGVESTIIAIERNQIIVHRLGGLKLDELQRFGKVIVEINQSSNPAAPGMLKSHYAPGKKVIIGDISTLLQKYPDAGVISFQKEYTQAIKCIPLSPSGNLDEAARSLFSALRQMDDPQVGCVLTEVFPAEGLGLAINDRLQRAAAE